VWDKWARTVEHAILDVLSAVDTRDELRIKDAVVKLLMLPSVILPDKKASRGRRRRINIRLDRYNAGEELDEPDDDAQPQARPRRARHPKHTQAARAHRQLTLGNISRAAKCIEAAPLAELNEANLAARRALHPAAPPPPVPTTTAMPASVSQDMLVGVLGELPKGSAPGPSGWTYEHIKAATSGTNSALGALLALVNAIVGGKLPHLPALLDCTLHAFEKPGGNGIRPIAVGEVFVRLAGLCAMASCPFAGPSLAPLQLGVGVKGGSQIIGHALRTGIAADSECVTVQLDFRNAFNSVRRGPMLDAIAQQEGALLAFAAWKYGQPSRLFPVGAPEGTPPIMSQDGIRQGDPPGGLYFGLCLQGPLKAIQQSHPAARPIAYYDDCNLQGPAEVVIPAFRELRELCEGIGLHANLTKCVAYSPNARAAAAVAAALGIRHCVDGMVVAGTPIGTDAFVKAHVAAKADAVSKSVDAVMETTLPAQDKLTLLRASTQHRTTHLMRVVRWELVGDAIQGVEDKVTDAAFQIMERPRQGGASETQMTLPLRNGGMGIRVTSALEGCAAFLSAAAVTDTAQRDGPPQYQPLSGGGPEAAGFTSDWQALHAAGAARDGEPLWPPDALELNVDRIDTTLPRAQREFARFVAQGRSDELLASFATGTLEGQRNRARLLSCQCRPAGAWIEALPVSGALTLSDGDFRSAMRHRLGLTHLPANAPGVRCTCGRVMQAGDTDHAMSCSSQAGGMQLRHEIIANAWRLISHCSGTAVASEPMLRELPGAQAGANAERPDSRGDLLLVLERGLTVADVSVVHPAADSNRRAARVAGGAAAAREASKRARYETGDPNGYAFVPLVVESYGRMGKAAMGLLNTLAATAVAGGARKKSTFVTNALRQLSVGLCRGNGVMYRRALGVLANATGRAFRLGMDCPTSDVL
jgi:hypothetical protein